MKYFRKLIAYRKLAILFAVGMLLRSTIAVGYMLDTNPADGSFLSIVICEGPARINAITGLENHDDHQQHHGDHDDHASQDHPISNCSFWSSSSFSLVTTIPILDNPVFLSSDKIVVHQNQLLSRLLNKAHFARAPPLTIS